MPSYKMNRAQEETVREVFKKLAKTQSAGEYGIVDFSYTEFIELSDGKFTYPGDVSGALNFIESRSNGNEIKQIWRGNPSRKSRWDVRNFIKQTTTESEVKETGIPPKNEVPTVSSKESTRPSNEDIAEQMKENVEQMMSFLKLTYNQMISNLNQMIIKLDTTTDDTSFKQRINTLIDEKNELWDKLRQANERLSAQENEYVVNKGIVYRSRNGILDEVERYLNAPGWSRNPDTLRKTIQTNLDTIMKEVKVGEVSEQGVN